MGDFKPCPFCGSDEIYTSQNHENKWYYAYCNSCDVRGPEQSTMEEAKVAWNDRVKEK